MQGNLKSQLAFRFNCELIQLKLLLGMSNRNIMGKKGPSPRNQIRGEEAPSPREMRGKVAPDSRINDLLVKMA